MEFYLILFVRTLTFSKKTLGLCIKHVGSGQAHIWWLNNLMLLFIVQPYWCWRMMWLATICISCYAQHGCHPPLRLFISTVFFVQHLELLVNPLGGCYFCALFSWVLLHFSDASFWVDFILLGESNFWLKKKQLFSWTNHLVLGHTSALYPMISSWKLVDIKDIFFLSRHYFSGITILTHI